jgi:hypothetical protein
MGLIAEFTYACFLAFVLCFLLWLEYGMSPRGSCVELGLQLVVLLWEVLETLGGGV